MHPVTNASIALLSTLLVGAASPGQLRFEAYSFTLHNGETLGAERGHLIVPEHRGAAGSRMLDLGFVRLKSTSDHPGAPIVYLAGGPGSSGVAAFRGPRQGFFQTLRAVGDVILLDQRGVGLSDAIPDCNASRAFDTATPLTAATYTDYYRRALAVCLGQWRKAGVDIAGYTTRENVADIEDLRRALGIEKLNLVGISYGTHLGLAFVAAHPERVAHLVLASVEGLDQTVKRPDRVDAAFARIDAAGAAQGEPLSALMRRVNAAYASPRTITFRATDGRTRSLTTDAFPLRLFAGGMAKNPSGLPALRSLYEALDRGETQGAAEEIIDSFMREPLALDGMSEAMDTASGISPARRAKVAATAPGSLLGTSLNFPIPHLGDTVPVPDLGDRFRREPKWNGPALIFSGDLDVRTPLAEQAEAVAGLGHRKTILIKGGGHNLYEISPDVAAITARFLRDAPVEDSVLSAAPQPAPETSQSANNLDSVFGFIASGEPGCVAALTAPGAAPAIKAYGRADLEHGEALTAESIFETGSLAKQFTASAVLLLVQDGKLKVDDDIRRYLPEMPDYGTPITIRNLLNHTSGLREQWSLLALTGNPPGTQVHNQSTILDVASRQKGLNFAPGSEFLYTNTNYALAAIIVERVSGKSLQQFTDERLFRPLGMTNTKWREDFRTVVPGRATAYAPSGNGFVANMPFTNVYGNGGLLTTVGDLLRWNAFLDKPSLLTGGPDLAAALQTPGHLRDGAALDYAMGLEIDRSHGQRLVAHSGSTGGYKTWLGRYPDQHISVAVMCNNGGIDPVAAGEKVATQALRATGNFKDDPAPATPRPNAAAIPADLTPYAGLFRDPIGGDLVQTMVADGKLMLRRGTPEPLIALGGDSFQRGDGAVLHFTRHKGEPMEMIFEVASARQRFVAVPPPRIEGDALAAFAGTYYSPELQTRIVIARQGNSLVMRQAFGIERQLTPSFADGFTIPLRGTTSFAFTRGPGGRVTGFGAWANGLRGLRFTRER